RFTMLLPPLKPRDPVPHDGQDLVPVDTSLCWGPPGQAAVYDLYLWTAPGERPQVPLAVDLAENCYLPPAPLSPETDYNCQVVARNEKGQVEGPVWTFRTAPVGPLAVRFHRGDTDGDGFLSLGDAIRPLGYLFLGSSVPSCLKAADTNDTGSVDLSDPVGVLGFLFLGLSAPKAPYPGCGLDPSPDPLTCESFSFCN